MRKLILAISVVLLLAPVQASTGQASMDEILSILETGTDKREKEERLIDAFQRLSRQHRLTWQFCLPLLIHPSGQDNYPLLNRALARADPERAIGIFNSLLKNPFDLPYHTLHDLQRSMAYRLSELTDSNHDDQLFATLRQEGDLDIQILVAGSFAASRRHDVENLAVAWSQNLDQGRYDTAARERDPLWGQEKLGLRRWFNQLLFRVGTEATLAELLTSLQYYVGFSPNWLVDEAIRFLGAAGYPPAYPLAMRVAWDDEELLETRFAALQTLVKLYTSDEKPDVTRVARRLLEVAKDAGYFFPEVQAIVEALEEE